MLTLSPQTAKFTFAVDFQIAAQQVVATHPCCEIAFDFIKLNIMAKICVTGSAGLIGRAITPALQARRYEVIGLDLHLPSETHEIGDVADASVVARHIRDCEGIIHLAAVSRVLWGQQDPSCCWETNVEGTRNVVASAMESPRRPWVLYASSREVYGQASLLPVAETTFLRPVNVYGRSKAEAERIVASARARGLSTAIVRLSNVYGSLDDYADRVVPAFARAASTGAPMRLEGADCTFDFTHLADVVHGLLLVVDALDAGNRDLPPIHFVTGYQTSLRQLAAFANDAAGRCSPIIVAPLRHYDVENFVGDPERASRVLGWRARITVNDGMARLVKEFLRRRASDRSATIGKCPLSPKRVNPLLVGSILPRG